MKKRGPEQSYERISIEEEKIMEDFYNKFFKADTNGVKNISLEQSKELKNSGITIEKFLNYLNRKYGYLFHGSRKNIPIDGEINSQKQEVYATSEGSVA